MSSLQDLPLHPSLIRAIDKLGYVQATEVQAKAIPPALEGADLMVSSQTGSGKTAAFLLPLLDRFQRNPAPNTSTRALILLPTRELALQTQKTFEQLAAFTYIKSCVVIGGEAFKHQVASLRKNAEVVIATPGRLVEHIEKGTTDFSDLEILILDEADRMLDLGFADDMQTIASVCNAERQNMLFSATLHHQKIARVQEMFTDPVSIEIDAPRQAHAQITQQRILCDDIKHKEKLVAALITRETAGKVMVFCNTRIQCQQLGNYLKFNKFRVDFIHGEIPQNNRKQIMNRFRSGSIQVLVATDVAARGLDIDSVELVINFTVANAIEDHVHRIGRTGRAGQLGKAITFVSNFEWDQLSKIERFLKQRFENIKVKGLIAHYKGPKKLKASGKIAGTKSKDKSKDKSKRPKNKIPKKNAGGSKASSHSGTRQETSNKAKRTPKSGGFDGFAPIPKQKTPKPE
ncbi:MAG: RNA helicase [SAR86 cluster bacterium]|uniref:RNA helicase n=1 Tax=SAR86 cluster bacterium TaxID=2030880 RepID=A0A2A4MMA8_9GAMM|nr:MAG: RNA helicase [SAR86 cluster bacterium]